MTLRELTREEIQTLSNRYGVKQKAVEDFLMGIGGVSIEVAYRNLSLVVSPHWGGSFS